MSRIADWLFLRYERLDEWSHARLGRCVPAPGFVHRFMGRREIAFYERNTDWDNPLYVAPGSELFDFFRAQGKVDAEGKRVAASEQGGGE